MRHGIWSRKLVAGACVGVFGFMASTVASAAPIEIDGAGVGGWIAHYDTRNAAGQVLTASDSSQIAAQVKFLGEGQTVNDAAGGVPNASPLASLNNRGYLRLDGTNDNPGKSDFSYFSATGTIASASALAEQTFSFNYRHYSDPNNTYRTVGLNFSVFNGTEFFSFSHNDPIAATAATGNSWYSDTVSATQGLFSLYGTGITAANRPSMTLAEFAADPIWGRLLDDDFDLVRIGFNLGSSQRNALVYVDYLQTNLLNNGDIVDFVEQGTAAVPEPGSLALVGLGLAALALRRRKA